MIKLARSLRFMTNLMFFLVCPFFVLVLFILLFNYFLWKLSVTVQDGVSMQTDLWQALFLLAVIITVAERRGFQQSLIVGAHLRGKLSHGRCAPILSSQVSFKAPSACKLNSSEHTHNLQRSRSFHSRYRVCLQNCSHVPVKKAVLYVRIYHLLLCKCTRLLHRRKTFA